MAIMLVACLVGSPARAASAAGSAVAITLTSVNPSSVQVAGSFTITGTLKNTSGAALTNLRAVIWHGPGPITVIDALHNTINSAPDSIRGSTMSGDPAANQTIEQLAPGASATFRLSGQFSTGPAPLNITSPGTVALVGVVVQSAEGITMGMSRFFMSLSGHEQVNEAAVVVLSSRPSMITAVGQQPAKFTDDHLAGELSARLGDLMRFAEERDVTPVIDPALYDEVAAMAAGYQVVEPDGSTHPGAGTDIAKTFLPRLTKLITTGNVYRTLYANPDVAAMAAANRSDALIAANRAIPNTNPTWSRPVVVIPANGTADAALLKFLSPLGNAVVLLSNLSHTATLQRGNNQLMLVSVHGDVFDGGPSPDPRDSFPQQVGRLQATELMYASIAPVVTVITTSEQAAIESACSQWGTRVPLDRLIARLHAQPMLLGSSPAASQPPALVAAIDRASTSVQLIDDLTGHGTDSLESQLISRAWSQGWGHDEAVVERYLSLATADTDRVLAGGSVQLHINPKLVLPGPDTSVPISVVNSMPIAVQVRVQFISDNPLRIAIPETELLTLRAGETTQVRITPKAAANGRVEFHAQTVTAAGRPFGEPVSFVVQETSAGRTGWLIIIASGVILLGATALRVYQVRRERSARHTDEATL